MKLFNYYALAAALFAVPVFGTVLTSCDDDNDSDVKVTNVTISNDPNNALRYPVSIKASDNCEVSLSYWPKETPAAERTTKTVETSASEATVKIMFVKPSTDYCFAVNVNGRRQDGVYEFTTSALPASVPTYKVAVDNGGAPEKGYIMQWQATIPGYITFCDMDANVVWYEELDQPARVISYDPKSRMIAAMTGTKEGFTMDNSLRYVDKIFTMDLDGKRDVQWRATNGPLEYPHHEMRIMPDGNLLFMCNFVKNYDLTSFGLGASEDVYGDGYVVVDRSGRILSSWSNYDNDEATPFNTNNVIVQPGAVEDLVHGNSVNYDSEGNYYVTFNRVNQLWKVEAATGKVLYKVGDNGDVQLDPKYIPSGIHAAEPIAPDKVLIVDNGENRGFSRAIIYEVDPKAMTAKVTTCIDYPGQYSSANRSIAELIDNGRVIMFGSTEGRANVFTDLQGNILKVITRDGICYRTHYYEEVME